MKLLEHTKAELKTNNTNALIIQTLEKYIKIAKNMMESENYNLDISEYSADEIYIIVNLAKDEQILSFMETAKNIDKLLAFINYFNAKEKMEEALQTLAEIEMYEKV